MPLFYFNFIDTGRRENDEVGVGCASVEEARTLALATLGEIAEDKLSDGDTREFVIEIRDDNGSRPLLRATLSMRVDRLDGG